MTAQNGLKQVADASKTFEDLVRRARKQRKPRERKELTKRGMLAHGYVYVLGTIEGCHKIGFSYQPEVRLAQFSNLPAKIEMRKVFFSRDAWMIEKYLHTTFSDVRVNGEWFRLTKEHLAMVDSIANPNSPRDLPKEIQERHKEQLFRQGAEVICPNLPVPKFDSVDTTPRAGMTNEDVIAAVALLKGIGPLDWIAENISQALSLTYSKSKLDGITLAFMVTADLSREIIKKTYGIHSF